MIVASECLKESETVELKKSTSELKEAIISVVAILNKHNRGELYFGVKNDGSIVGQDVTEKTLREVSKATSDNIEPKIYPKISKALIADRNVVKVEFGGLEKPYFAYGRAYIRVSDEDKQLSAKELENFILSKNKDKLRWDNRICKRASLNDIDYETIKRFVELVRKAGRIIVENDSEEMILRKLELLTNSGLTNAGILLFGKAPNLFFKNITLRCGRFKGAVKSEFIDLKDFEGNLFIILEKAISFCKEHLELRAEIKGLYREEKLEIPLEALREAIINSLIHRDYFDNGEVYVKIYDNELVIANPGKLPDELNIEKLYKEHESRPKNLLLAMTFYYAGLIDKWGRGISNMIKALKENNLPLPKFEQSGGSFRIKFKRLKKIIREKTREKTREKIINLIKENSKITLEELSTKLNISTKGVEWQITKLKKERSIKRAGPDKGGHWEVNLEC
ncbi:putative DNA binding domain-containing protein [Candidatus Woesearchaeota archaeon]|nr:putative DNA binding domain-containing protein [Candidatus Woesearchaeota archaeon]